MLIMLNMEGVNTTFLAQRYGP